MFSASCPDSVRSVGIRLPPVEIAGTPNLSSSTSALSPFVSTRTLRFPAMYGTSFSDEDEPSSIISESSERSFAASSAMISFSRRFSYSRSANGIFEPAESAVNTAPP